MSSDQKRLLIVTNSEEFKNVDQYLHKEQGHEKFLIEGDIVAVSPLIHYLLFSGKEQLRELGRQVLANASAMSEGTHQRQYRLQRSLLQGAQITYTANIAQQGGGLFTAAGDNLSAPRKGDEPKAREGGFPKRMSAKFEPDKKGD